MNIKSTKDTHKKAINTAIAAVSAVAVLVTGTVIFTQKLAQRCETRSVSQVSSDANQVTESATYVELSSEPSDDSSYADRYTQLSPEELNMLSEMVAIEASGKSYECWEAVASVVINRMMISGHSLEDVIYADSQFASAEYIDLDNPSYDDTVYAAVEYVAANGPTLPKYVTYYKFGEYPDWSDRLLPYCEEDGVYFSYDYILKETN